jgi:collagen type IV alpha
MVTLSNLLSQNFAGYTGSTGFIGSRGFTGSRGDTGFTGSVGFVGSAAAAQGGGSDEVFYENDQTVTANYTIPTGKNALTTGPVEINNDVTITVSSGSRWVII